MPVDQDTPQVTAEAQEALITTDAAIKLNGPALAANILYQHANAAAGSALQGFAQSAVRWNDIANANAALILDDMRSNPGGAPSDAVTLSRQMNAGLPSDTANLGGVLSLVQQVLANATAGSGMNLGAIPAYIQLLQRGVPSSPQAGAVVG